MAWRLRKELLYGFLGARSLFPMILDLPAFCRWWQKRRFRPPAGPLGRYTFFEMGIHSPPRGMAHSRESSTAFPDSLERIRM